MDHEAAAKTHAIERYLLGEMPTQERDSFEEHYFTCAACAEEIRFASGSVDDIKGALREMRASPQPRRGSWRQWFSVLVPAYASMLTVAAAYVFLAVIPQLEAPLSMGAAVILDGRVRGDAPQMKTSDPLRFVTAVEGGGGSRLRVELSSSAGKIVRHGEIAAPAAGRPLDVYFPGSLAAGRYQLVVRDPNGGRELARSDFEIVQ